MKKSDITKQVAADLGLQMTDIKLALVNSDDLRGLPVVDSAVVYDRCYDCGAGMLPDALAGYLAGTVVDGAVWVRCPNGCRGGWRPA